ncbi:MAG: Protoheme IX farnesyltransferase 1 [Flavobacteriales bacterium]|nr:MAG: Protoheme IX farnesyltransferase 1 [Flavobacteriales bacterium]|tara:strand:+ start:717 stop:1610 length:894 start_codon:yes stop_codon:yes gene_type:complete
MLAETQKPHTLSLFINDVLLLTKARLTLSVVFSSIAGYLLAVASANMWHILLLSIGGYGLAGASNAFNQIIEKEIDAKMIRTQNRPIPAGRMSTQAAFSIAITLLILGLVILYALNPKTAMFGAISVFLYTCAYTPLKTVTPLSVFVGAIPGAIPFMLGWVSATGNFGIESGILFMIQFFWQFPHFWAIGWMMHSDYQKAGINMLPTGSTGNATALQIILYTLWTIVISIIPVFGFTEALQLSVVAAVVVGAVGLMLLWTGFQLYRNHSVANAKKLMIMSIAYITAIQWIYVLDKFI